jgi:hypothetical protein
MRSAHQAVAVAGVPLAGLSPGRTLAESAALFPAAVHLAAQVPVHVFVPVLCVTATGWLVAG